jgi:hypothetical protein
MSSDVVAVNARRQLEDFRLTRSGTKINFRGTTFYAFTSEVSGAETGQAALPREFLGRFTANSDPRLFKFNASHFTPVTTRPLPEPREFITYLGWSYEIVAVTADTAGREEAFGIRCYAMKAVYPTESYLFAELAATQSGNTVVATGTVV